MAFVTLKSIVIYLIFSGIVLNFSPNPNYKRYIRFFSGLLLLIILARPVMFLFHLDSRDLEKYVMQMDTRTLNPHTGTTEDTIFNYYEMAVAESIRMSLLEQNIWVDEVIVLTNQQNEIVKCTIWIQEPKDEQQQIFIKKIVSDVYNLETNRIYIVRR